MNRDTANAVALGMVIGGMLANALDGDETAQLNTDNPDVEKQMRPEAWQNIGWDQIVNDVDRAAEALDRYQEWALMANPDFWDEHDWYLTLDKIAEELWRDPNDRWDHIKVERCLVKI